MADEDDGKIIIPLELEGDDTVAASIDRMSRAMTESFGKIEDSLTRVSAKLGDTSEALQTFANKATENTEQAKDAFEQLHSGVENVGRGLGEHMTRGLNQGREAIHLFRSAIHILHPVLGAAGIEMGRFGGFMMAARAGIAGLTVAITGAVIFGLSRLAESAKETQQRLSDLLKSPEQGKQVFHELSEQAEKTGTSVNNLSKSFENLTRAMQESSKIRVATPLAFGPERGGAGIPPQLVEMHKTSNQALFELMRVGAESDKAAAKARDDFIAALRKNKTVTPDMMQALQQVSEVGADRTARGISNRRFQTADQMVDAIQKGQYKPDVRQVEQSLVFNSRDIHENFQKMRDEYRGLKDATDELTSYIKTRFSDLMADSGLDRHVTNFIDKMTVAMKRLTKDKTAPAPEAPASEIARQFTLSAGLPISLGAGVPTAGPLTTAPPPSPAAVASGRVRDVFDTLATGGTFKPFTPPGAEEPLSTAPGGMETPYRGSGRGSETSYGKESGLHDLLIGLLGGPMLGLSEGSGTMQEKMVRAIEQAVEHMTNAAFPGRGDMGEAKYSAGASTELKLAFAAIEQSNDRVAKHFDELGQTADKSKTLIDKLAEKFPDLTSGIEHLINVLGTVKTASAAGGFTGGLFQLGQFFAGGGPVYGKPGRDTNPAWLTSGEFVMRPEAVQHYGTPIMHALNSMQFGLGGLVADMIPALHSGGAIAAASGGAISQRPFVLQMSDGTQFGGMTVADRTVDSLTRFAVNRRVTQAGVKPSWNR